jgi:hypothetical protein
VEGNCVDLPSEAEDGAVRARVKLKAYPLVKIGKVLWTYMGRPEHKPPPPEFEFATVPDENCFVSKRWQECNWLQAMEGGIDSSHVGWLHKATIETDPLFQKTRGNKYTVEDFQVGFEIVEQPSGLYIGARRKAENGNLYWRITAWVMPYFTQIPPRGDHPIHGHFWVPMDDENCWTWNYDFHPARPLSAREVKVMEEGEGIHCKVDPKTFRSLANKDNDYQMDRMSQKSGHTFSGIAGFAMQDASLQESMGAIVDRSREHLVATDLGVVTARRQLIRAANALAEQGTAPPGIDPATHLVRSASIILPARTPFMEGAREGLKARKGMAHTSV